MWSLRSKPSAPSYLALLWKFEAETSFPSLTPHVFLQIQVAKPDCTERLKLQRRLGCRTFHWFLANVYPKLYPSEHRPRFSGKARHGLGEMGYVPRQEHSSFILGNQLQVQQGPRGLWTPPPCLPTSLRKASCFPITHARYLHQNECGLTPSGGLCLTRSGSL